MLPLTLHEVLSQLRSNLAMTSVTPVCTLADLILYAATRTALIGPNPTLMSPAANSSSVAVTSTSAK
jgi:hypothetical protein